MRVMYEKSPIAHVKKVKTPVMLNIGKVDLRVPPSQGHEYYHALKALGKYVEARNVYISGLARLNAECGLSRGLSQPSTWLALSLFPTCSTKS